MFLSVLSPSECSSAILVQTYVFVPFAQSYSVATAWSGHQAQFWIHRSGVAFSSLQQNQRPCGTSSLDLIKLHSTCQIVHVHAHIFAFSHLTICVVGCGILSGFSCSQAGPWIFPRLGPRPSLPVVSARQRRRRVRGAPRLM